MMKMESGCLRPCRLGSLIQPLINLLREQLLAYDIQGMDETRIQVLKEPDRGAENPSQM